MILQYPAFVLQDDLKKRFTSKEEVPETYFHVGATLGRDYATSVLDFDLFGQATKYQGPVLIFHGDVDNLVPISYSKKIKALFENASFIPVPNEGHVFSSEADVPVINQMLDFYKANL